MVWGFKNKQDAVELKDAVPYLPRLRPESKSGIAEPDPRVFSTYVALVTVQITARVGVTPGKGNVTLLRLNQTSEELEDSGYLDENNQVSEPLELEVYSLLTVEIDVDEFVFVTRDVYGTLFVLNTVGSGFVTDIRWDDPVLEYSKDNGANWINIDTAEECS